MPASDMTRFMRNDADDFVRCFGLHDRARIDENTATINEGIEALRIDENNTNPAPS